MRAKHQSFGERGVFLYFLKNCRKKKRDGKKKIMKDCTHHQIDQRFETFETDMDVIDQVAFL
jgi:hypothetical protein